MARVNVNFRGFGTRFNPIIGPPFAAQLIDR
jgi:hypothetical protein